MFIWNGSLAQIENVLAMAKAVENANNQKFFNVPDPWQTDLGDFNRAMVLSYQSRTTPSIIVYTRSNRVVFAIAGIQGAGDALSVYQGAMSLQTLTHTQGRVNAYAKTWYENAFAVYEAFAGQSYTEYLFIGHSWGGTTATLMAMRMKQFKPSANVRLCTMGSPRFATQAVFESLQGIGHIRVHAHNDPVPYLMPWFSEAPLFHIVHDPFATQAINSLTHPGNGLYIKRGQQPRYLDRGEPYEHNRELSVFGVRSLLGNGTEPHWPSSYVSIMQDNYDDLAPRFHNAEGQPSGQRSVEPPPVGPREAEAIANWPALPWPANAVPKNEPPALPPPPLPDPVLIQGGPKATRARMKKVGKTYFVYIGDTPVYKATSKRDARGVRRAVALMGEQYFQNPGGFTSPDTLIELAAGHIPFGNQ